MENQNQVACGDALLSRIDDAMRNYERFGATCEFEGQPMIYASVLTEIAALRADLAAANEGRRAPESTEGIVGWLMPDGEFMPASSGSDFWRIGGQPVVLANAAPTDAIQKAMHAAAHGTLDWIIERLSTKQVRDGLNAAIAAATDKKPGGQA